MSAYVCLCLQALASGLRTYCAFEQLCATSSRVIVCCCAAVCCSAAMCRSVFAVCCRACGRAAPSNGFVRRVIVVQSVKVCCSVL